MEKGKVRVINEVGLHARPAALFVAKAASFKSDIRIHNATKDGKWVSAKSILGILTLGVEKDHEIEITAEGEDEVEAVKQIIALIESDFA
ncbi:MAG TPA: HPr family phosphocarrier protein [Anaerolineaceae bacterium]|jgi:phosphotransferase system HPr (HPr) family protein|nr:HPr family phosphocarrier protein [Anaerolineaceae bacterium]